MATKTTALTDPELDAWRGLLRAHARATRLLDAELTAERALPLGSYEVLLHLAAAPGRRMRMTDLANSVLLSRSGVTRLVDRLERDGLLRRESCPSDLRGTNAVLTEDGLARLRAAATVHLRGVREHVTGRFDEDELRTLAALLGRIGDAGDELPRDACGG